MTTTTIKRQIITITPNGSSATLTIPREHLHQIGLLDSRGNIRKEAIGDFNFSDKYGFFFAVYSKGQIRLKNENGGEKIVANDTKEAATTPDETRTESVSESKAHDAVNKI